MSVFKLTRRRVLIGAAGATVVAGSGGLWLGIRKLSGERFHNSVDRGAAFAPSVYLAVEPSGDVVIWLTRSEMGQGVGTALPMLIADELDADWSRVRVEQAVAGDGYDYGQLFTAASSSVSGQWIELRRAGATAREMLVGAAADRWGVKESECQTRDGVVSHPPSGQQAGYGELAEAAAQRWPSLRPKLKAPEDFRLIGTPVPRLDIPAKVQGQAEYGMDVQLPGMLRGVVARSPVFGGSARDWDDAAARSVAGVRDVIAIDSGVAVVAETTYAALRGREALKIEWDAPADRKISHQDVAQRLRQGLDAQDARIARDDGDVARALDTAREVIEADYEVPYAAHACMEPMNCTAQVVDGTCQVWVPTQAPDGARRMAAAVSGLPLDRVVVHTTLLGGGFGRRTSQDFVREAVAIAMAVPQPVQVVWTREDDLRHGEYREATAVRLRAALNDQGYPTGWTHRVASAVEGGARPDQTGMASLMGASDLPYEVEHLRVEWLGVEGPLPGRIWRAVGHVHNAFAAECFIDELATSTGIDPLEYRRRLLGNQPRLVNCLDRVADMCDWHNPGERFLGLAASHCMGSFVAQVVEVAVGEAGQPRIEHVWCAADCGTVVNPDTVKAQVEGGILFGLDAALYAEVRFENGTILEGNFDRHRLLRIGESPLIEIAILDASWQPSGVGEIGVPAAAPALANAWYQATGKRIRALPMIIQT